MPPYLPTFLLIGAAKSGTTACYHHLKAHPEIFMSPVKEPRFFAFEGTRPVYRGRDVPDWSQSVIADFQEYTQLFDQATSHKAIGEASVSYLYEPGSAKRIKKYVPEARLVVILRNPVERAYSQFLQQVKYGVEIERDFLTAITAEPDRIRQDWCPLFHYVARGRYHEQLLRYFEIFDREQISVYLYDDFKREPSRIMRDMYAFVGVSPDFLPALDVMYNISGVPKSRLVFSSYRRFASAVRGVARAGLFPERVLDSTVVVRGGMSLERWLLARPEMSAEARARLKVVYRDEVLKLQDLLDRDLTHWL